MRRANEAIVRGMQERNGLVLSGGGARGAYEVGVLRGVMQALAKAGAPQPFEVFTGTSAGAINAAYFAAHADLADLGVDKLAEAWRSLALQTHFRVNPLGLLPRREPQGVHARALVNVQPLRALIDGLIPWSRLHANTQSGRVHAAILAALEIAQGRTTLFAELAPTAHYRPSRDARRVLVREPLATAHVLASAAIPVLFPPQRVGERYYCDGGLRHNTPISPAIRAGATRLVIVSVSQDRTTGAGAPALPPDAYPHPSFLLGKVLDALLLDPLQYDLQVLKRINRLLGEFEQALSTTQNRDIAGVMQEARGAAYHPVQTLVFSPSQNIGQLAAAHVPRLRQSNIGFYWRRAINWMAGDAQSGESDLLSFVLFDGAFARDLIELGQRDVLARADEVRAFFLR